MKLESKLFNSFFYPFLTAVFLSLFVVFLFSILFTKNNYDKKTSQNIINVEKNFAKINLKSAGTILTSLIYKFQVGINEEIQFYKKIAHDLLRNPKSHILQSDYVKCAINIDKYYCEETDDNIELMADWVLNQEISEDTFDEAPEEVQLQLIAFSNIIPNLYGILHATFPSVLVYYFYFENTDLYASYPLSDDCAVGFAYRMGHNDYTGTTCMDENGEFYTVYKVQCEAFFQNMRRTKDATFDYNYLSHQHKSIFINNFYYFVEADSPREFSMCIEFDDPIAGGKAYACVDVNYKYIISTLDNFNSKLKGYYFVTNIGFNNVFYFPESTSSPLTPTEYIYNWNINYKLDEKDYFNIYRKVFSTNYIEQAEISDFDEVYVNGKNSSGQFFYINEEKYRFSIYPIILENLNKQKEHIFSIIYIYTDQMYFDEFERYSPSIVAKVIIETIFFLFVGFEILYLIYLTLNNLSKYIVIPMKNVEYMLKGINIGGESRLKYLDSLKKRAEETHEKLEKMYLNERNYAKNNNKNKNNNNNKPIEDNNNNILKNNENDNQDNDNLLKDEKIDDLYDDYDKEIEEEADYIEKENNFFDFDEQLLQYRSLETEQLVKSLMNLKDALILTSEDREVGEIIHYSQSENTFDNFKIKAGSVICESNIGNLLGQLLQYDKSIYHLATSLQDNTLKKFIDRGITDEYDGNDYMLYKVYNLFNKENKKKKNNKLVEKQIGSTKDIVSQKVIGILINTRYCRLIQTYYLFFKNLLKLQKSNDEKIDDQFMHTDFHTINYYHKILVQYIYLCYEKKDLVKIGESMLDYIEFLIKFKFKTVLNQTKFLKIHNRDRPEYQEKLKYKKFLFDKIVDWFDLFDDYISYIKEFTTLGDMKNIVDDYLKHLNSENNEFDLESHGALMFRVNIQRYDFLKGKLSLACKNYKDALFYFIRAAKVKSIVTDGLIKKKSLKHIYKITLLLHKYYESYKLNDLIMEKVLRDYKKDKNKLYNIKFKIGRNRLNRYSIEDKNANRATFGKKIEEIITSISEDIDECNEKQEKDILILIDYNIYDSKQEEENIYMKTYKVDVFIEQAKIILNNYLSTKDRYGVLIYAEEYQIICPLMVVNQVDFDNFSNNLNYYKKIAFNEKSETEEFDIFTNESNNNDIDFNSKGQSEPSLADSSMASERDEKNFNKGCGLIEAVNYLNNYSKMKESIKNDKYFIIFTDFLNVEFNDENRLEYLFEDLVGNKDVTLLLIGKANNLNLIKDKKNLIDENKNIEDLFLIKFGDKSELIYIENMKQIKSILSNSNVIKDEIIYPNEIYK